MVPRRNQNKFFTLVLGYDSKGLRIAGKNRWSQSQTVFDIDRVSLKNTSTH